MKIIVTQSAVKQLLKIPYKQRKRIENKIEALIKNPFPFQSKKLSGRNGWRLRVGDYRVLYFFDKKKKIIIILSAQHRKDANR